MVKVRHQKPKSPLKKSVDKKNKTRNKQEEREKAQSAEKNVGNSKFKIRDSFVKLIRQNQTQTTVATAGETDQSDETICVNPSSQPFAPARRIEKNESKQNPQTSRKEPKGCKKLRVKIKRLEIHKYLKNTPTEVDTGQNKAITILAGETGQFDKSFGEKPRHSNAPARLLEKTLTPKNLQSMKQQQGCKKLRVKIKRLESYKHLKKPSPEVNTCQNKATTITNLAGEADLSDKTLCKSPSIQLIAPESRVEKPKTLQTPKTLNEQDKGCKILNVKLKRLKTHRCLNKMPPEVDTCHNKEKINDMTGKRALKSVQNIQRTAFSEINETSASQQSIIQPLAVITPQERDNFKKLSLRKTIGDGIAQSNISKDFEMSRFSPIRNSTVFEPNHDLNITKENNTPQNLAQRSDIIENLLHSDEDEEIEIEKNCNILTSVEKQSEVVVSKEGPRRFFHRLPPAPIFMHDKVEVTRKNKAMKWCREENHARKSSNTKAHNKKEQIYEFLSQSQTSDSDNGTHADPAADIVQKLILEGKVRVATNCKGKGRPMIKRRPKGVRKVQKKPAKKKLEAVKTNLFSNKPEAPLHGISTINRPLSPDSDDGFNLEPEPELNEENVVPTTPADKVKDDHSINGRFSRLARSVLLHQAERSETERNKSATVRRKLLEYAKKFVSTPANKHVSLQNTDISPISAPQPHTPLSIDRPACPSPWRVNDESHLPNVFYFSKNTSHLPSFSCDFIPPTPKKDATKTWKSTHNSTGKLSEAMIQEKALSDTIQQSSRISSFSSNDSNAENMPPPQFSNPGIENTSMDVNADIFNKRQFPNPRQSENQRSPLKAINILDVLILPPLKKVNSSKTNDDANAANSTTDKDIFGREDLIEANSNVPRLIDDENAAKSTADTDIFGFEDLIVDDSDDLTLNNNTNNKNNQSAAHLHEKLLEFQKFRPTTNNLNRPQLKPIRHVFDDDHGKPKQLNIKEMLCSTMIKQNKAPRIEVSDTEATVQQEHNAEIPEPVLFKDFDPDVTFHPQGPIRTYENPRKKKRKLCHNVMFTDSHSESEEDEPPKQQQKKCRKAPLKSKAEKSNEDLESFADEFNSMCKEVESYQLVVE